MLIFVRHGYEHVTLEQQASHHCERTSDDSEEDNCRSLREKRCANQANQHIQEVEG